MVRFLQPIKVVPPARSVIQFSDLPPIPTSGEMPLTYRSPPTVSSSATSRSDKRTPYKPLNPTPILTTSEAHLAYKSSSTVSSFANSGSDQRTPYKPLNPTIRRTWKRLSSTAEEVCKPNQQARIVCPLPCCGAICNAFEKLRDHMYDRHLPKNFYRASAESMVRAVAILRR